MQDRSKQSNQAETCETKKIINKREKNQISECQNVHRNEVQQTFNEDGSFGVLSDRFVEEGQILGVFWLLSQRGSSPPIPMLQKNHSNVLASNPSSVISPLTLRAVSQLAVDMNPFVFIHLFYRALKMKQN